MSYHYMTPDNREWCWTSVEEDSILRAHRGSIEKGSVCIVNIVMLLLINIKLSILLIYKIER